MKKYHVVSIGGATRDINFYTREGKVIATPDDLTRQKVIGFEYGAKIISENVSFELGGGGCNSAICLSRLGLSVANFICLGMDREGDAIVANLKHEKVDISHVKRHKPHSTGFSFVIIDSALNEHIAFLYRGANNYLDLRSSDFKDFKTDWFYVSSLSGKNWYKISQQILRIIKNGQTKLAWNPGETQLKAGRKGLSSLLKNTEILILNKDEAIELVLSSLGRIKRIREPKVLLKTIKKWGPKILVITCGRKGAYAYDGREIYYSPIYPIKVADTTGAGDCFGASFLAGMIWYRNIKKAIRLASVNTAFQVAEPGAQKGLLYLKDLKKYLK